MAPDHFAAIPKNQSQPSSKTALAHRAMQDEWTIISAASTSSSLSLLNNTKAIGQWTLADQVLCVNAIR